MTVKRGDTVKHDRFRGIALRVLGTTQDVASVRMVGDDQTYSVPIDELTALDRDEYCAECGQVGCSWG